VTAVVERGALQHLLHLDHRNVVDATRQHRMHDGGAVHPGAGGGVDRGGHRIGQVAYPVGRVQVVDPGVGEEEVGGELGIGSVVAAGDLLEGLDRVGGAPAPGNPSDHHQRGAPGQVAAVDAVEELVDVPQRVRRVRTPLSAGQHRPDQRLFPFVGRVPVRQLEAVFGERGLAAVERVLGSGAQGRRRPTEVDGVRGQQEAGHHHRRYGVRVQQLGGAAVQRRGLRHVDVVQDRGPGHRTSEPVAVEQPNPP
jgi:hypothetical protein